MKFHLIILICFFAFNTAFAQDLSQGYITNDVTEHPMQAVDKPGYLSSFSDPSFPSTTIRRISNAVNGEVIAPMYSTIQAWNADESLLLVYTSGTHQLLDGTNYSFIRTLSDINPEDIETLFWHFNDPGILFYIESESTDFISYHIETQVKTTLVNLANLTNCSDGISFGNDVQMMSWDSDVFSFRCGNSTAYYYRISNNTLTEFNISDINYTAPMPFPSGQLFYHQGSVYDTSGELVRALNLDYVSEHSCLGQLSNGDDAYFAIAFEEGPNNGCQGTLVAHNATNGHCFSVTPTSSYGYPKRGTHISALAHNNTVGGWVAVSMIGYEEDGQSLLDQELFIAQVNENDANVYRVAHHRSDENEFDYFGEPHVTISPSGTRLLFGSDWSGTEDGQSVDCYIAELNAFTVANHDLVPVIDISIHPNPASHQIYVSSKDPVSNYQIYSIDGQLLAQSIFSNNNFIDIKELSQGIYVLKLVSNSQVFSTKFCKL